MIACPYCKCETEESCGIDERWAHGSWISPLNAEDDREGFAGIVFECKECDREFHVNEAVFLNYEEDHRGKSHFSDVLGMPEVQPFGEKREPVFKCHKYHIEADQYDQEFLQDMAFAFGYEWEINGQKYLDKKFEYLSIEPEAKRMWYNLSDPKGNGDNGNVDLRGFMQVLNGIEPSKKPDEIEVGGNPVEFCDGGAILIPTKGVPSLYIPYRDLVKIMGRAKVNFPDDIGSNDEQL